MALVEALAVRSISKIMYYSTDMRRVKSKLARMLILLVAHFPSMSSANVWMMAGTVARHKFFNIMVVSKNLSAGSLSALFLFHALTGCDTRSYYLQPPKLSVWKTFQDKHHLLTLLGEGELSADKDRDAEKFICAMYNCRHIESVNDARDLLLLKTKKPDALPPTKDALEFHIKCMYYLSLAWKQASRQEPILPNSDGMGWKIESKGGSKLVPLLMSKEPTLNACKEIISCSCKSGCTTLCCWLQKSKIVLYCHLRLLCGQKISCKNKCNK